MDLKKPIKLTDGDFAAAVKKYPLIVVDFWAAWCGPCKMVAPVIDELSKELSGKVVFGKVNIDEDREIAGQLGIMSIPTLVVFKGGVAVDKIVGALPKEQLLLKLNAYL
ncbi:MAG: thioredoxin [Candidatus Altiarchaeales archaeon IMC4]|nr:MAG: thioredoxin [Candidatus Altiarchaeales archaeon IMC4]